MINKLKAAFLAVTLMAVLPVANASSILYAHPFDPAPTTPPNNPIALCTPCDTAFRAFDVFDLTAAATLTGVQARVQIRGEREGYPLLAFSIWTVDRATQLFSQSLAWDDLSPTYVSPGFNNFGSVYDVTAALTSFSLTAGSYSLSIYGAFDTNIGSLGWYTTKTTVHGRSFQSFGQYNNRDMQFRILGESAVPAPATLALFGLALGSLGISRRKSKLQT